MPSSIPQSIRIPGQLCGIISLRAKVNCTLGYVGGIILTEILSEENTAIENIALKIRVKIRLDFRGTGKPIRFFPGRKSIVRIAEENREQQAAIFRNVPIQGVFIEDINMGIDAYTVYDDILNTEVAYAPLELLISADSLKDVFRFITRDDFRKIDIIDPQVIIFTRYDIETLLYKVNEEMTKYKIMLERKINR